MTHIIRLDVIRLFTVGMLLSLPPTTSWAQRPVIADQVEDAMLGRRRRMDTRTAEEKAVPLRSLLKFERKLREQIDRLREQLDESRRELSLTPQHVQSVVEIALELAGQPPLQRAILKDLNEPELAGQPPLQRAVLKYLNEPAVGADLSAPHRSLLPASAQRKLGSVYRRP